MCPLRAALTTMHDKSRLLAIARAILSEPTAPFHEGQVRAAIAALLESCPHLRLREDGFGNLIAHYRGENAPPSAARWAFVAHMDHPGWVTPPPAAPDEPPPERIFLGGVGSDYLSANRERIRDFGDFAMWDLPAFEVLDGKIHSRACDDLIGCAAIAATLLALSEANAPCECYGLFTRAEEVGFVGAIEMARSGWLTEAGLTVISLETSAERPPAKMGDGPIVRVGDRLSIFDPGATAELLAAAKTAKIAVQRCLMSGGACEATAFQLYGVRSAALCIALGNYHNHGPGMRIEPEFVSCEDFSGLADLCTQIAQQGNHLPDSAAALRGELEEKFLQFQPYHRRDRLLSHHE
jgi:putative aminopeptidase FrvX